MITPEDIYRSATPGPNKPKSIIAATSFTMGAEIKYENVTPKGTPDSTKPMKRGTAEQEQNGVTIPIKAAKILPTISKRFDNHFLVFSGGRYERIMDTTKIMTESKRNILILSKMKKLIAPAKTLPFARVKTVYVNQSANSCTGKKISID